MKPWRPSFGIELEYTDIWGNRHTAPESTLLTLLRAMGVDIDTPDAATAVLEDEISRLWKRPLEPVYVVSERSSPIAVTVRAPRAEEHKQFSWFLEEEKGAHHEGRFRPVDLERLESRELNGAIIDRYRLLLPIVPDQGYHRFTLTGSTGGDKESPRRESSTIIVTPDRCYMPPHLSGGGANMGGCGTALRPRFGTQLGYRRLHRPLQTWLRGAPRGVVASSGLTLYMVFFSTTLLTLAPTPPQAASFSTFST